MNQDKLEQLEKKLADIQAQIDEMKEQEFEYPMYFRSLFTDCVVRFDGPEKGELVVKGLRDEDIGYYYKQWACHTNTSIWTQVTNPDEYQVGDWCLFWDDGSKYAVISKLIAVDVDIDRVHNYRADVDWYQHCIKYKGELPPHLKGK